MSTDLSLFPVESSPPPPQTEESGERTSLYRAYRSRTFAEVVGQQHVTQTLRNAVIHGKVGHAYIFTGPRGTGKTSTARILARAVNCLAPRDGEPCNECTICVSMLERRSIDLIEIDGASNNSVDDVRELRDRVQFRPAEARRKVFIIDEVHMLSIGAFNALLKTLEEPPDHILFLLATTEIHKVPLTVLSRCQRHDLRSVPLPEMTARLRYICTEEGLEAEDAVIQLLATLGTGSLRDAESLLEQVRAYCGDNLRLADVETALGVARMGEIAVLADLMAAGDLAESLLLLGTMMDGGIEPRQLTRQLSGYWRDAVLARARRKPVAEPNVARCTADKIVAVLRSLLSVESVARRSDSPRFALELAVAEATLQLAPGGGVAAPTRSASLVAGIDVTREAVIAPRAPVADDPRAEPIPAGTPPTLVARRTERVDYGAAATNIAPPPYDEPPPFDPDPYPIEAPSPRPAFSRPVSEPPARSVPPTNRDMGPAREPGPIETPDGGSWIAVLRRLQQNSKASVYQFAQRAIRGAVTAEQEVLSVAFLPADKLAMQMLEKAANRQALEQAVREVYGGRWTVRCVTISETHSAGDAENQARNYLDEIAAEFTGGRIGPSGA